LRRQNRFRRSAAYFPFLATDLNKPRPQTGKLLRSKSEVKLDKKPSKELE